jgi:hypothetical protein
MGGHKEGMVNRLGLSCRSVGCRIHYLLWIMKVSIVLGSVVLNRVPHLVSWRAIKRLELVWMAKVLWLKTLMLMNRSVCGSKMLHVLRFLLFLPAPILCRLELHLHLCLLLHTKFLGVEQMVVLKRARLHDQRGGGLRLK